MTGYLPSLAFAYDGYERLGGLDRYLTAIEISRKGWPEGASNVILTSGKDWVSIVSSAFAGLKDAPVLITETKALNSDTLKEIRRLKARNIYILGSFDMVSAEVEDTLKENFNVERIGCLERFDVAVGLGDRIKSEINFDTVIITTKDNYPDLLAAAPFSAKHTYPVLFTGKESLRDDTKNALSSWNIKHAIIVGGSGVVSDGVKHEMEAMGVNVTRLWGIDRYITALEIVKYFNKGDFKGVLIATGENYPDALSGAALGGKLNMPILFVGQNDVRQEVLTYLSSFTGLMYVLGGTGVVSDSTAYIARNRMAKAPVPSAPSSGGSSTGGGSLNHGNPPVLSSIQPSSGPLGTIVTIRGNNFSKDSDSNIVTFNAPMQGQMAGRVIHSTDNELKVITPGLIEEAAQVSVKVGGKNSGSLPFTIQRIAADPTPGIAGNEAQQTLSTAKSVVDNTLHEIQIAMTPFMTDVNGLSDEAAALQKGLNDLSNYMQNQMSTALSGKSERELAIADAVFSMPAVLEQLQKLKNASELLSHSTTGESLDNIDQAKSHIRDVLDALDELETILRAVDTTAAVAAVLGAIFTFGAVTAAAAELAATIEMIIQDIINPLQAALGAVYSVLNMAPTEAVQDSLVTYHYDDDLKINQYFGSMEKPMNSFDPGAIIISKPYSLKGHMDFVTPEDAGVDFLANGMLDGTLMGILKYIGAVPEIKLNLEDVDVKLKLISENPGIIKGEWKNDKLLVSGVSPGETKVKVVADLAQVGNKIPEEKVRIERTMRAISAYQETPPYDMGPKFSSIDTDSKYIGDILTLSGEGFSKSPKPYQDVFFGPAGIFNSTGLAPKWHQSDNEYNTFKVEVPDALTGNVRIEVGGKKSNEINLQILPPRIDYSHPSAIKGEAWPVKGQGFSHTSNYNTGDFNGGRAYPAGATEVTEQNHETANILHKRLDFIVPQDAADGPFKVTTIGVLNSNANDTTIRQFSGEINISNPSNYGLRPSIARDDETNKRAVAWIDQNVRKGNQLVVSLLDSSSGNFNAPHVVSTNIGGIGGAPPAPALSMNDGRYFVTWVGKDQGIDDVLFSWSDDGISWSEPINISETPEVSVQPAITTGDFDGDGDFDAAVVWTEEAAREYEHSKAMLCIIENTSASYSKRTSMQISGSGRAADPSIDFYNNKMAIGWSEDYGEVPSSYARDIFVRTFSFTGISPLHKGAVDLSRNTLGKISTGYTDRYRSARNPSIRVSRLETDGNTVYAAYENTGRDYREDIFFARIEDDRNVTEPLNVSYSKVHSQSPKLELDGDNTPTLTWVEQGFENGSYTRNSSFTSKLMFARSFDRGESFNSPYMVLDTNDGGKRIGHPVIAAGDRAYVTIVWQDDDGVDGKPHIALKTTEGNPSSPGSWVENNLSENAMQYVMRTYSPRNFLSTVRSDPRRWREGSLYISETDGSSLRQLTRDNSVYGLASMSPDGRYISYASGGIYTAEADGSHPVDIWLGEAEGYMDTPLNAFWSPTGKHIFFNGIGEMFGGIAGSFGSVMPSGLNSQGMMGIPSDTGLQPVSIYDRVIYDKWSDGKGLGIFNMEDGSVYEFDESKYDTLASWSPDGRKIAFIRAQREKDLFADEIYEMYGNLFIKDMSTLEVRQLTEGYTASTPAWSPDGSKIAFVKRVNNDRDVYIIPSNGNPGNEENMTSDPVTQDIAPVFSQDGTKLFVNSGVGSSYMKVRAINLSDNNKSWFTSGEGSTGMISTFAIRQQGVARPSQISVYENAAETMSILLTSAPSHDVTINIASTSSEVISTPTVVTFTPMDWNIPKDVTVRVVDNNTLEGDRHGNIKYTVSSQDPSYDGIIVQDTDVIIMDDEVPDTEAPTWPNGSGIITTQVNDASVKLSWPSAQDNTGVVSYILTDNYGLNAEMASSNLEYTVENLSEVRLYTFTLKAKDASGNISNPGLTVTFKLSDSKVPEWKNPSLTSENVRSTSLTLNWDGASDNYGVTAFKIYQDGNLIDTVPGTQKTITVTGLTPDTSYVFKVEAEDGAGNLSITGPQVTTTTLSREPFEQGEGYEKGEYDDIALQPTAFNWSRQSRFAGSSHYGMKWRFGTQSMLYSSPAIGEDGTIYFGSGDPILYAVNSDGTLKWSFTTNDSSDDYNLNASPVVSKDGSIYIVSDSGILYALNPDGTQKWQPRAADANETFISSPVLDMDGNIYLVAKESASPNRLFTSSTLLYALTSSGTQKWKYRTYDFSAYGEKILPVIAKDGTIYFGAGNKIYAMKKDGAQKWYLDTGEFIKGSLSIGADGAIYGGTEQTNGSQEGKLIAVDPVNKNVKWKLDIGAVLGSSPAVSSDGTIYAGSIDGNIYAVNSDGTLKWKYNCNSKVYGTPIIDSSSVVYFGCEDGNLFAVKDDVNKGTLVWKFKTAESLYSSAAIDHKSYIYFTSTDGYLYCVGTQEGGEIGFKEVQYSVSEDGGKAQITLVRNGGTGDRAVRYETSEGSASSGTDYDDASGFVTFRDGETEKSFEVTIKNDANTEGNETVNLTLQDLIGSGNLTVTTATLTIIDDEAVDEMEFESSNYSVSEDGGSITVKVVRHVSGSPGMATVDYATNNGNAAAGTDYEAASGTLTFGPSDTEKTLTFNITDDNVHDGDKSFVVTLKKPTGGTSIGSKSIANITINDNETSGSVQFVESAISVNEGDGSVAVTLERTGDKTGNATVEYSLVEVSTSAASSDYSYDTKHSSIVFGDGEDRKSFNVTIVEDLEVESSETIVFEVRAIDNAVIGTNKRTTITIADNDSTPPPIVPAVTITLNGTSIEVTGASKGARLTLYGENGGVANGPVVLQDDETSYTFPDVPEGTGYYVTQKVNEVESPHSNTVDVVYPKVGDMQADVEVTTATVSGIKVTLSDMPQDGYYYYSVSDSPKTPPQTGSSYGSVQYSYMSKITGGVADDIPANSGQYISIIEVIGDEINNEYGGIVKGFYSYKTP